MKREIEIIAYSAERTGVSKKDGQQWYNRDIVVQWFEEGPNGRYEQQTVVSINKRLNPVLLESAVKNRENLLRAVLAVTAAVALATCALMLVRRGQRVRQADAMRAEAVSMEASYNDIVSRKEALKKERESLEAEEAELLQQIVDAEDDTGKRLEWVAEVEGYLSQEAAYSQEAYSLEQEIASLEAWLSREAAGGQ